MEKLFKLLLGFGIFGLREEGVEEISDNQVKEDFDKQQKALKEEEQAEAPAEKPKAEKEVSEAPSEGEKPVTEEESIESLQQKKAPIPYHRWGPIYEGSKKAAELEEAMRGLQTERDPITGKLRVIIPKEAPKDEDEMLSPEEQLVFDEQQWKVIEKAMSIRERQILKRQAAIQEDNRLRALYWNKAIEEFPALADEKSELRIEAEKICREEYAQAIKDAKGNIIGLYLPPKANLDAAIKAERVLRKRAEEKEKALKESGKMKDQNAIVSKTKTKQPAEKAATDEDLENMTDEERTKAMEKEFNENKEKLEIG